MTPKELLRIHYEKAMLEASGQASVSTNLPGGLREQLDVIISHSENAKGVFTVVFTSVVYKLLHPNQDIRRHQASIEGGYSGRGFDTAYITPFLKEKRFPAMAESGWLTRSLEQKVPYDDGYPGAIKPESLKKAFLDSIAAIENDGQNREAILDYLMQASVVKRDRQDVLIATPQNLSITDIVSLLDRHFHNNYHCKGASRLPVLALYAVYKCLVGELRRYEGKKLLPLESHTSADARSGRMGDIEIDSQDGTPFEAVEVKFDIPVSFNIVETAVEKIGASKTSRYYILSTAGMVDDDKQKIYDAVRQVKNTHGCQLVVNGVETTLKYYLRLIDRVPQFIDNYAHLLAIDKAVKYEHKAFWNRLVANIGT